MSPTPRKDTVISWLQWKSETSPKEEALVSYNEDFTRKSLTYEEVYQLASRYAFILKRNGVTKGDNVVNGLPNCLEQVVAYLGIILAGAVQIAVEVFLTSGETFFEVLEKTKAKYLIVHKDESSSSYSLIKQYLSSLNDVGDGYCVKVKGVPKNLRLEKICILTRDNRGHGFLESLRNERDTYQCASITGNDPCAAASTASSTSMVRLVLHTHGSIISSGISSGKGFISGEKNLLYDYTPTWVTSFPCDFLIWGITRVFLDRWTLFKVKDEDELRADVIEKEKIQLTFLIPPHAEAVANKWKPRPFPMIDHLWTGGMPVSEEISKRLMPTAKKVTVRYMSSEVPTICYNSFTTTSEFKDFDCGLLDDGCQVRTTDDQLQDMGPNRQGRLLLKTKGMFHTYIGEPEDVTASHFTSDGWYITHDGGYRRTHDNHLMVMGRNDDMISHNVWVLHPSWLEKDFKKHPDVNKVVVIPIPDDINFQNICACIVRRPGSKVTAQDLKIHFRACYVDEEQDSFGPSDILFFDRLPEKSPGQTDKKRATEIALKVVEKAQSEGISTDDLDTIAID